MADTRDASDLAVMTFELLKRMQAQMDRIEGDVQNIKVRMSAVEVAIGQLNSRMDRFDDRLVRIEKRLDLTEAPNPAAE
jgi:predicted  nucleic acid-binding Zn-ribbon protein